MPDHPIKGCPLCIDNGMIDEDRIIAMTDEGLLIVPTHMAVPGSYLLVPRQHIADDRELPGFWQQTRKWLLQFVPWIDTPGAGRNGITDNGVVAGQTVAHIHEWIVPRIGELPVSEAYHIGPATLIGRANDAATLKRDASEYGID